MRRGARQMMTSTKNDPHPHGPHVITYSATLDVPEATAALLPGLLIAERRRRGTGVGARAASARIQAVLVLRWFRQDTGMPTWPATPASRRPPATAICTRPSACWPSEPPTCTGYSRLDGPPAGATSSWTARLCAPTAAG